MARNISVPNAPLMGITYDFRGATTTSVKRELVVNNAIGGIQTLPSGVKWAAFAYGNNHGPNVAAMNAASILGHIADDGVNTMTDPDDYLTDQVVFLGVSDDGLNLVDVPLEVINVLLNVGLSKVSLNDL